MDSPPEGQAELGYGAGQLSKTDQQVHLRMT